LLRIRDCRLACPRLLLNCRFKFYHPLLQRKPLYIEVTYGSYQHANQNKLGNSGNREVMALSRRKRRRTHYSLRTEIKNPGEDNGDGKTEEDQGKDKVDRPSRGKATSATSSSTQPTPAYTSAAR
jgi:hypothetical protein